MNQKTQRFATIRKIIRSEQISSQEELIARLSENGVETIWGEAYLIKDGWIEKICEDGQIFHVY